MKKIYLSTTLLLAYLLSSSVGSLYDKILSIFNLSSKNHYFYAFILSYLAAAIIAIIFVKTSKLGNRVNITKSLGNVLTIGIVFSIFSICIRTWSFNMQIFGIVQFYDCLPLINALSKIFLIIGVTKLLLSAQPLTLSLGTSPPSQAKSS